MFLEVQGNSLTVLADIKQSQCWVSAGSSYSSGLVTFQVKSIRLVLTLKVLGTQDVRVGVMIEQKCFLIEQCQKSHRDDISHLRLIGYCSSDFGFVRYCTVCNFCGTDFKHLSKIDCHF